MSETLLIAIIAASSGIIGALVGGIASVVGSWWLKKLDHKKDVKEMRRQTLIKFCRTQMEVITELHQVFQFGKPEDKLPSLLREANDLTIELYSLIPKREAKVKERINNLLYTARSTKPGSLDELITVDLFVSHGMQYLLSWHIEEKSVNDLKPFGLTKELKPVTLISWDTTWPLKEKT